MRSSIAWASLIATTVAAPEAWPKASFAAAFPGEDARDDTPSSSCNSNTTPKQIRLAYAGTTGMTVSWNTNQKLSKPTVYLGKDKDELEKSASSDISATYPTSSTYNNHVTITGLKPNTVYYYIPDCGDGRNPLKFRTARKVGDNNGYSFAMVGDMGTMGSDGLSTTVGAGAKNPLKPGEKNSIESLLDFRNDYDFVWHVGDIAYADAWLKEEIGGYLPVTTLPDGAKVYDRILNDFYDQIEPISNACPYMVGPGNHEANCDNGSIKNGSITYDTSICLPGQLNFTGFRNHWKMPSAQSNGVENFWYSWDNGMVHFIQFNTETDFPNAPDLPGGSGKENAGPFAADGVQLAWLENDLKSVDRSKTPWIIAGGHRPWFISGGTCVPCRTAFEGLLSKYNVDAVLFGHDHFYDRQAPIQLGGVAHSNELNNPAPGSPWYLNNGAAGHYDGLDAAKALRAATSRKVIETVYGWSKLTIHNCTHLTVQFIASGNGTILDTATLYKQHACKLSGGNGVDDDDEN